MVGPCPRMSKLLAWMVMVSIGVGLLREMESKLVGKKVTKVESIFRVWAKEVMESRRVTMAMMNFFTGQR